MLNTTFPRWSKKLHGYISSCYKNSTKHFTLQLPSVMLSITTDMNRFSSDHASSVTQTATCDSCDRTCTQAAQPCIEAHTLCVQSSIYSYLQAHPQPLQWDFERSRLSSRNPLQRNAVQLLSQTQRVQCARLVYQSTLNTTISVSEPTKKSLMPSFG